MALIGKIRQNGWILILGLGLALFAFIIQDIVQNTNNYKAGDVNTIGKVNGVAINKRSFDTYQEMVYGNSQADPYQVRSQVFSYFVESALVKEVAEKVGLGVPKDELLDLEFGNSLSPIIQQRFTSESGMVNIQQLQQIKGAIEGKTLPAEYRQYWSVQEDEIIKDRLQSKFTNMISKAIYTPKWQAEMGFAENNKRYNFSYVRIPFDKVDPSEVKLTDADYKSFLDANKEQYYQDEETRTVELVQVDVVPTAQDSLISFNLVNDIATRWKSATNDSAFLVSVQGGTYNEAFLTKAELPAALADTLTKTATGAYLGPILADGSYSIAKILARKAVPDSVRARHILIKTDAVGSLVAAEALVDSIITVLATGKTSFDSLAARFGSDATVSKGGDLGWFGPGQMVKPFNDAVFYKMEQGKTGKIQTNFGWHVLEVTGKKFTTNQSGIRLGLVSERVRPSKATTDKYRSTAEAIVANAKTYDQLKESAGKEGLQMQIAPPVRENDFQLGTYATGQEARDILRWAFDEKTKAGNVSKQIFTITDANQGYFDSKYYVAAVKSIRPKGYASVADVKQMIETQVMNQKKGEILISKIKDAGNMEAVASQFGATVDAASNVNFLSPQIGQGGMEPKVVGRSMGMKPDEVSKPIAGNAGVYIVTGSKLVNEIEVPSDLSMFKKQLSSGISGQVRARLFSIMKKKTKVDDFRSRFY
jgi:peptidyl-prolyl cis-trans isomerase D